jgi:hypothetical protein
MTVVATCTCLTISSFFFSHTIVTKGTYLRGEKEGRGTTDWRNGDIHTNYWTNDLRTGHGSCKYANIKCINMQVVNASNFVLQPTLNHP